MDLLKGIVVFPLLSFYFFFLSIFSIFCSFVASLALSIYLSFVLFGIFSLCPLWDFLFVSSLGSFPRFKGNTLYITRMKKINTLSQGTHIKTETLS